MTTTTFARAHDGTRLAVQCQGAGSPLVLLAGQANNHTWWNRVREDFHAAHRTVTMDFRGTGASDAPDGSYSTRGFAEDVVAVLDALDVDRADVYGTSMGGRVAQWLAACHPGRVRHLILGCTSPGGQHAVEPSTAVRRALAGPNAQHALADMMYTPRWRAAHPGPYTTLSDRAMPAHARRHHLRASNEHDAWDVLPEITAPTLILHGDNDILTPVDNAWLLASRIPHARLEVLPGARHGYFEEFRRVASQLALDFLADQH
jgi:pimeloyl-ACP methyl ester carboxylesterase